MPALLLILLLGQSTRRHIRPLRSELPISTVCSTMPSKLSLTKDLVKQKEVERTPTALHGRAYKHWLAEEGLDGIAPPVDKPSVGLQNLGNMCFLNALIQSLHQTPMLRRNLLRACPNPKDEWLTALSQIFQELDDARTSKMPVNASRLASLIMRASPNGEFARGQQADAHEAFMLIISNLLSGCVVAGDDISFAEREQLERSSLIGHIFGMDVGQSIVCNCCSDVSITSRTEYCLCVSCTLGLTDAQLAALEQEAAPKKATTSTNKYSLWKKGKSGVRKPRPVADVNAPETSVDELLRVYTREEEILEWKCEKCPGQKGCTKTVFLPGPPNILCIHVYARQGDGLFGKITRRASFNAELDLSPFIRTSDNETAKAANYSLYAVIVYRHLSPSLGHYIVYIRSRDQWHLLDDQKVRAVDWSDVQSEDPYMLVYEAEKVAPPKLSDAEVKAESEAEVVAEAKAKVEAKAKARRLRAKREAKRKAEAEAKQKAEEEAQIRAQEEEAEKAAEEARLKAEEEAAMQAKMDEEARLRDEEDAQMRAEMEAMAIEDEYSRRRALEEAHFKVPSVPKAAQEQTETKAAPASMSSASAEVAQDLRTDASRKLGRFGFLACCQASSKLDDVFGEMPAHFEADNDSFEMPPPPRRNGSWISISTSASSWPTGSRECSI